jgi:hypothetical protein
VPLEQIPHLPLEDVEASIQVLEVMRSLNDDASRQGAYRLVLTELHTLARNARDISNGTN